MPTPQAGKTGCAPHCLLNRCLINILDAQANRYAACRPPDARKLAPVYAALCKNLESEIMEIVITVVAVLAATTILYKVLPHRNLGQKKPILALFPKYKNEVPKPKSVYRVEEVMSSLGFEKKKDQGGSIKYSRGSIAGDISVKLMKINVTFSPISNGNLPYTVEAAWVVAFDTGDHWDFTKQLGDKIESA